MRGLLQKATMPRIWAMLASENLYHFEKQG